MPELPEVETVRRTLLDLKGSIITDYVLYTPTILKKAEFDLTAIKGKKLIDLRRRGKFLIFDLGSKRIMVIHLGMSGRLFREVPGQEKEKHLHFSFTIAETEVRLVDPRRFGGVRLITDENSYFAHMGPEPLEGNEIPGLKNKLSRKRSPVKAALLDQGVVAGIGNIYADEILFTAGVDPRKLCAELNAKELDELEQAIPRVLAESIAKRGTTFRDYRDGYNQKGDFVNCLSVYGRKGEPCPRCGTPVECIRLAGRSTHFCPVCQK